MFVVAAVVVLWVGKMAQCMRTLAAKSHGPEPTSGRRKITSVSCPLTSIYMLWHARTHKRSCTNEKEIVLFYFCM